VRAAFAAHDALILSGGTSKGAGDLTVKVIAGLGAPGIVAHGVALKPGKPLCLAVCDGKPVVVLPGFRPRPCSPFTNWWHPPCARWLACHRAGRRGSAHACPCA
jgi:molybdopterin biosynthesis enzyme